MSLEIDEYGKEEEEETLLEERKVFMESWITNTGIFKVPIESMDLNFPIPTKELIETLIILKQKGYSIPKLMTISPLEDDSKYSIVHIISRMSSMVKELEIIDHGYDRTYIKTSIYEFFQTKIDWPSASNMSLKRLRLMFNITINQEFNYENLEINQTSPPGGLEDFIITLKLTDLYDPTRKIASFTNYIPQITQLAKAMFTIGGRNCQYSLNVTGNKEDRIRTDILDSMLNREISDIRRRSEDEIPGWKGLLPEERNTV